jgi:hypothetical protein
MHLYSLSGGAKQMNRMTLCLILCGCLMGTPLAAQDPTALTEKDVRGIADKLKDGWLVPPGLGPNSGKVRVIIKLKPDGTLAAPPEIQSGSAEPINTDLRDSVLRAIYAAQPFKLNPANYDKWKELDLGFNATDLPASKPSSEAPAAPPAPAPPKPPGAPQS